MLKFPISYKYQLVAIIQVSQHYSPLAMSTCHIIFPTSYAILTFSLQSFTLTHKNGASWQKQAKLAKLSLYVSYI